MSVVSILEDLLAEQALERELNVIVNLDLVSVAPQ